MTSSPGSPGTSGASGATAAPEGLDARYGGARRSRRAVAVIAGVSVSVAFLAWLGWATVFHSSPAISSEEIGYEILDANRATIRVQVEQDDDVRGATCSLRAISPDKAVVGETTFTPDPADGPVYTIEVRTDRRATTVEWLGCKAEGQPRFR